MNREEIKERLSIFRPGTEDETDPFFAEALKLAREDSDLSQWLDHELAFDQAMRGKFSQSQVPASLKSEILESVVEIDTQPVKDSSRFDLRWILPIAALLVFLLINKESLLIPGDNTLKPVKMAQIHGSFTKDVVHWFSSSSTRKIMPASSEGEISGYFNKSKLKEYRDLTPAGVDVSKVPVVGCQVLTWDDCKIRLTCFRFENRKMHYFVINNPETCRSATPEVEKHVSENRTYQTASWSDGERSYLVLTTSSEANILQRFLQENLVGNEKVINISPLYI